MYSLCVCSFGVHHSESVCRYVMRTSMEWDRFMRFMERYAEDNGLGFEGYAPPGTPHAFSQGFPHR